MDEIPQSYYRCFALSQTGFFVQWQLVGCQATHTHKKKKKATDDRKDHKKRRKKVGKEMEKEV